MAGFFFIKGSVSVPRIKNLKKVLIKIGKLPGLIPRPSESQVWLYYSDERGGSIEGRG